MAAHSQQELFDEPARSPTPSPPVPGLTLVADFIDEAEEARLLDVLDREAWSNDWKRRVQVYGLGYGEDDDGGADGDRRERLLRRRRSRGSWLRDLPDWVMPLAARMQVEQILPRFPENVVVNEYVPGVGIGPHRDYPAFGPTIACVSLGSPVVLDFIHPGLGARVPVDVPARSLWVITGEARRAWQHGIAHRKNDIVRGVRRPRGRRVSITFRTARGDQGPPGVVRGRRESDESDESDESER